MSYCRFSSMNWMCDVYVYEDCYGGWTTHVAARRRLFPPIPDLPLSFTSIFKGKYNKEKRQVEYPTRLHSAAASIYFSIWSFWHRWLHMGTLNLIPMREIDHPEAGKSVTHDSPLATALYLSELKQAGFNVPTRVINALTDEQEQINANRE